MNVKTIIFVCLGLGVSMLLTTAMISSDMAKLRKSHRAKLLQQECKRQADEARRAEMGIGTGADAASDPYAQPAPAATPTTTTSTVDCSKVNGTAAAPAAAPGTAPTNPAAQPTDPAVAAAVADATANGQATGVTGGIQTANQVAGQMNDQYAQVEAAGAYDPATGQSLDPSGQAVPATGGAPQPLPADPGAATTGGF